MESPKNLHLTGFIKEIKYQSYLTQPLTEISWHEFNINDVPSYGLINLEGKKVAYSKWVSPKRSRGYPLARVYNTYNYEKVLTVIPIIKDEGKHGSRDIIQYSTISWMSLLNIYVIIAYYDEADISKMARYRGNQKITNQKFNNDFVLSQIDKINECSLTASEWNENILKLELNYLFEQCLKSYHKISQDTGIILHSDRGIYNKIKQINQDFHRFKNISLNSSLVASKKEVKTKHRLEYLEQGNKATCQLEDYLGGVYYLTFDEVYYQNNKLVIQESKNTLNHSIPQLVDLQQALFKLILHSNINSLYLNTEEIDFILTLKLTSKKLLSSLSLPIKKENTLPNFFAKNYFLTSREKKTILLLNKEAKFNKFIVKLGHI